jgi:small subunit ribosomal protein S9
MSLAKAASSRVRCSISSRRVGFLQAASASTSTQTITPSAPRLPPRPTRFEILPTRIKPVPSSFYTARPTYIDSLIFLEELTRKAKRALQLASIPMTLPSGSSTSTVGSSRRTSNFWLKSQDLSKQLGVPLKSSQYRHIVARLVMLSRYQQFVKDHFLEGQCGPDNRALALSVEETLLRFSRNLDLSKGKDGSGRTEADEFYSASSHMDDLGRAYARGRRKESTARVWIVPKVVDQEVESESLLSQSVLVNLQSLPQAFTRVSHRESVLYPLRLTGLVGVVNVFTLVQGGGSSGQAGAIAHGIARSLVTLFDHQATRAESTGASNAKELRLKAVTIRDILAKGE